MQESSMIYVKEALHRGDAMKNRIEEIRKEKGIRQDELGKMLGVSRQTISSLENGRYNPSIMLAHKIAVLFGMSIEDVFIFEKGESENEIR
jgi:putative transcriptional regulator